MAQSSLLESVKEKTGKFSVSVDRVVNLDNYESLRVGFAEVLDLGAEKPEEAYARILQKVNGWTAELKPAKPKLPSPLDVTSIRTEPTINIDDHYLALPWKQSQKKQNLATILVTQELLENPVGLTIGVALGVVVFSGRQSIITQQITTRASGCGSTGQPILDVCYSPSGDCGSVVAHWILRANSSVHIMIYEFTLSEVGDAIIHAIKANPSLDVRIIWDSSSVNVTGSQYSKLLSAGINIHIDHRGGIMHDKVAIIDDHIVITGSFNWSQAANEVNRENLIVIDSVVVASSYEQNFQQNYAATK